VQNLWLWVLVGFVLWQWPYLHQFYRLMTLTIRPRSLELCSADDIDAETWLVLEPYITHLSERGFSHLATFKITRPPENAQIPVYRLHFHRQGDGVYAILETAPYPGVLQPVLVSFLTLFQSGRSCHTMNGVRHFFDYEPDDEEFCDHYLADWREILPAHLRDREIEGEVVQLEPKSPEELLAESQEDYVRSLRAEQEMGLIRKTQDGFRYRPSWSLWRMARRVVDGQRRFASSLRQATAGSPSEETGSSAALLSRMKVLARPKRNRKKAWTWFGLSAAVFFGISILLGLSVAAVVALMIVLLVHELGHWGAMRIFGYNDVSIFFLPFGAVTTGRKEERAALQEYLVFIMGPLPGLLIGVAILAYLALHQLPTSYDFLGRYAFFSLFINYINLLPILPLDGGRIVQLLLLPSKPKAQLYFYVFSLVAIAAATIWLRDPLLLILVAALAMAYQQNRAAATLAQKLIARYPNGGVTQEQVAEALAHDASFAHLSLPAKAALGHRVWSTLRMQKPKFSLVMAGFLFYLFLLAVPLLIALAFWRTL